MHRNNLRTKKSFLGIKKTISKLKKINMAALRPKKRDCVKVKLPALGKSNITATAISAPTIR